MSWSGTRRSLWIEVARAAGRHIGIADARIAGVTRVGASELPEPCGSATRGSRGLEALPGRRRRSRASSREVVGDTEVALDRHGRSRELGRGSGSPLESAGDPGIVSGHCGWSRVRRVGAPGGGEPEVTPGCSWRSRVWPRAGSRGSQRVGGHRRRTRRLCRSELLAGGLPRCGTWLVLAKVATL